LKERIIRFVTDLPKSPKDMAERLKRVPLWYKSASLITVASLAACQLGKKLGYVTPPPEGTQIPPTETVPPTETPTPFVEPGRILDLEKDQGLLSPEIKKEFENFDALHPELEGRDVYKFTIQSPIGQIGFATHEVKPEEIETAIIAQSEDGKTAISIPDRALYVTAKDAVSGKYSWSRLLGIATPGASENTKIISWFYLPEGYPKAEETTLLNLDYPVLAYQMPNNGEFLFWYPVMVDGKPTWSSDYQMAVVSRYESLPEGARKVLFSLLPVEPTPTPEAVLPTMSQEQIGANIDSFLQRTPEMTFLTVKEEKRLFRDSYSSSTIKILPIGYYEISSKLNDNRVVFPVPGRCQGVLLGYRAFENKDVFVIYAGLENLKTNERLVVPFWMFRIAPNEQPWLNYLPPLYIQNVYPPDWGWVNGTQRLITGEPREVLSNLRLALLQPVEIAFEFGFNKTFTGYEKMSEATYQSLSGSGNAGFALVNWMEGVGPAPQYDYQNPDINSMPANDTLVLPHPQNNQ